MNCLTILIISLAVCDGAAQATYLYKWAGNTKAAVATASTGTSWVFSNFSNGCTTPTTYTIGAISADPNKLITNPVGFLSNDTVAYPANSVFGIVSLVKFANNANVGFTVNVTCPTNPGNSITMNLVAADGANLAYYPNGTITLNSGVEHILSIVGAAMLLLLL